MSLEAALARVDMIRNGFAPRVAAPPAATNPVAPAPLPGATPPTGTFAGALQGAMTSQAAPGTYPHLTGDLDASPALLQRLEALAASRGETWTVTSGGRTFAEQSELYANRGSNPFPVATPGSSRHESGRAADVMVNGRPIQDAIPASVLQAAGLAPLSGDAVHVELPAGVPG